MTEMMFLRPLGPLGNWIDGPIEPQVNGLNKRLGDIEERLRRIEEAIAKLSPEGA